MEGGNCMCRLTGSLGDSRCDSLPLAVNRPLWMPPCPCDRFLQWNQSDKFLPLLRHVVYWELCSPSTRAVMLVSWLNDCSERLWLPILGFHKTRQLIASLMQWPPRWGASPSFGDSQIDFGRSNLLRSSPLHFHRDLRSRYGLTAFFFRDFWPHVKFRTTCRYCYP